VAAEASTKAELAGVLMDLLCNLLDSDVVHLCVLTNVLTPNLVSRLLISITCAV
jgi:hypothetical protein